AIAPGCPHGCCSFHGDSPACSPPGRGTCDHSPDGGLVPLAGAGLLGDGAQSTPLERGIWLLPGDGGAGRTSANGLLRPDDGRRTVGLAPRLTLAAGGPQGFSDVG